jgi:hypothetical protein
MGPHTLASVVCRKKVRVGSCGFKHSNRPALFARFGLTPNVEHVLLLLPEIFPDRIGRLPDASLLDHSLAIAIDRSVHGVVQSLFRVGRHLMRSVNHRLLRIRSFLVWHEVTHA